MQSSSDRCLLQKRPKLLLGIILFLFCLIGGGFFPIVNFNPDSPSRTFPTQAYVLAAALVSYWTAGAAQGALLPRWACGKVLLFYFALAVIGPVGRFLLEFGEVSMDYYFALPNVLFQTAVLFLTSIAAWLLHKRKPADGTYRTD